MVLYCLEKVCGEPKMIFLLILWNTGPSQVLYIFRMWILWYFILVLYITLLLNRTVSMGSLYAYTRYLGVTGKIHITRFDKWLNFQDLVFIFADYAVFNKCTHSSNLVYIYTPENIDKIHHATQDTVSSIQATQDNVSSTWANDVLLKDK